MKNYEIIETPTRAKYEATIEQLALDGFKWLDGSEPHKFYAYHYYLGDTILVVIPQVKVITYGQQSWKELPKIQENVDKIIFLKEMN